MSPRQDLRRLGQARRGGTHKGIREFCVRTVSIVRAASVTGLQNLKNNVLGVTEGVTDESKSGYMLGYT